MGMSEYVFVCIESACHINPLEFDNYQSIEPLP